MIETPKSLTAIVHVKFNYSENKQPPVEEGEIELLNRIINQGSDLSPQMQDMLAKFADHLSKVKDRAEPLRH